MKHRWNKQSQNMNSWRNKQFIKLTFGDIIRWWNKPINDKTNSQLNKQIAKQIVNETNKLQSRLLMKDTFGEIIR